MIHFKDFLRKDAGGQLAAAGAGQGGMGTTAPSCGCKAGKALLSLQRWRSYTPENAVEC